MTPLSIDFGSVEVGTTSSNYTVTITNSGSSGLYINSTTIIDSNANQFICTPILSNYNIIPRTSVILTLNFKPSSIGQKSARLRIASNDSGGPVNVALTGCGITTPKPDISVVPMSINFGDVLVGIPSAAKTVNVKNEGTANLTIGTLAINNGQFTIFSGDISGNTLVPGASANISLVFTPANLGPQSANLTIPSNDADENPVVVTMSGNGIVPDIAVNPMSIDFEEVLLNTPSAVKDVTVTNEGTANLTIGTLTINNSQFTISGGNISGQTLIPGASANISLVFHPTAAGAQSANLTIPSNDPDENPVRVALLGEGMIPLEPEISVKPGSIDFGDVLADTDSAVKDVTVTNQGTANLTIGTLAINNSQFTIFSGNISGQTLAPGASANISLIFHPTASGAQSANLTIPSNDADENPVTVALTGNGIVPDIAVNPQSIGFGDVLLGTDSEIKTVTVTNEGTANLTIGTLTINNGLFTISSGNISGNTLIPGASANISLVFHPTAADAQSANLTIPSNDPDENPVVVTMSGNGIVPDIAVNPQSIGFGDVLLGTTSAPQTVTVTNQGTANLTIGTLAINNSQFTIFSGNISGNTLIPGASANISLVFHPTAEGAQSADLTIPSNDPAHSTVVITLTGNGKTEPDITVAPTSLDFGFVQVAHPSTPLTVKVTNIGTGKLIISGLEIIDTQFVIIADNITTVAPGGTANITIVFTPAAVGAQSANLTITSNDPDHGTLNVPLSGIGSEGPVAPDIVVTPLVWDFGDVLVGDNSTAQDVTVTNNGTANLIIGTLTISDTHFAIASGNISNQTLGPGASANITLYFAPTAIGPQSGDPDHTVQRPRQRPGHGGFIGQRHRAYRRPSNYQDGQPRPGCLRRKFHLHAKGNE